MTWFRTGSEPKPTSGPQPITVNGQTYAIPTCWGHVHWSVYDRIRKATSTPEVIQILTGSDDPALVNEVVIALLSFVYEPPLEAVLIKTPDQMPLECYINGRQAYRNDATDYFRVVRAYWPVCADDADTVISRFAAVIKSWNDLDTQFAVLNTEPTSKEKQAGADRLAAFYEYGMVYQLAGADITKEDAILQVATRHVFMHRAYALVKSEFEAKMIAKAGKL